MSVPPVRQENRKHELRFPFNKRELLIGWRTLYFKEGEYVPDPKQSAQWNRGAYLVEGLGHCAMCHTAINALGGSKESQEFEGGMIPNQNWYAPSLTSNREAGLGDWEIKDIADLLQVGVSQRAHRVRADGRGRLQQPAVPERRRRHGDGRLPQVAAASATPRRRRPARRASSTRGRWSSAARSTRSSARSATAPKARGSRRRLPPLAGNQSITMASPVNSIRMVLNGGYPPGTKKNPKPHGMPPFSHILNDDEVAAVVTYIRVAWDNSGTPVQPSQANELRKLLPE